MHVTVSGKKIWRLCYKFQKQEKTLTLGNHPSVTLTDAQQKWKEAKRILRDERNPAPFSVPTGRTVVRRHDETGLGRNQHDRYSNVGLTRHHSFLNSSRFTIHILIQK
ncbi:integrase [Komagataeibacter intermedius AF2]|uniref:Integrase n=1 Tax=Komagataeibacter intermedius AF2 TaxID=1458464 RepID=A0A0N1FET3_9PROT|nr:integrase [Komagataeibacter intermedius AF2]